MADLFVRMSLSLPHSPKLVGAPPAAKWLYAVGIIVSARELSNGIIRPGVAVAEAEVPTTTPKRLIERRLWHRPGHDCDRCEQPPAGQVVIHDYLDHQQSAEDVQASKEAKSRAGRKGAASRWDGTRDGKSDGSSHSSRHAGRDDRTMADLDTDLDPSVTQVSHLTVVAGEGGDGLTDEIIQKIATRLGSDVGHARRVARRVLAKAQGQVRAPLPYVLAAIDEAPAEHAPTPRGVTVATACPAHPGYLASNCGGCRSEQIAGDR